MLELRADGFLKRPLLVRLRCCLARQLEARLTEERAELVASNGLLDQNERLRAAIVAEEREKFQSEKVWCVTHLRRACLETMYRLRCGAFEVPSVSLLLG